MINEIWKDIVGYEGLHQVSNLGNVKSISRIRNSRKHNDGSYYTYKTKDKILKFKADKDGYLNVRLSKNGIEKMYRVHRIVATAFLVKPDKKDTVHHIDECVTNNNINNLQWVTTRENLYASNVFGKLAKVFGVKIVQYDIDGKFINSYQSMQECSRQTGIDVRHISAVVNGKRNSTKGFVFVKAVNVDA